MIRRLALAPFKLPFRIARLAFRTLVPKKTPEPEPVRSSPPPREAQAAPAGPPPIDPRSLQTSPEDIFELQKNGVKVVFVDVREPSETRSGIVEGALLIPSGQIPSRFAELESDVELVLYCASGMRSTNAAAFLRGKGYDKAKSLVGGFSHWQRDGGATSVPS